MILYYSLTPPPVKAFWTLNLYRFTLSYIIN